MSFKHVLVALGTFALLGIVAVVALAFVIGRDAGEANRLVENACAEAEPGMTVDEFLALADQYEIITIIDGRETADEGEDYVVELMHGSFRLYVACVGEFSSRDQLIGAAVERHD